MKPVKFLYTDGRDVVVTQSILKTKKGQYRLKGVTDFGLAILRPQRLPGLLFTLIGLTFAFNWYFQFIPTRFFDFFSIPSSFATSNLQLLIGISLICIGLAYMLLMKRRYVVRIETAEGKKNAVISRSKEYIDQILNAIRKAKPTRI